MGGRFSRLGYDIESRVGTLWLSLRRGSRGSDRADTLDTDITPSSAPHTSVGSHSSVMLSSLSPTVSLSL